MTDATARVDAPALARLGTDVMQALGCPRLVATEVAEHLVDAELCGVYSHGVFRLDWYAQRALQGKFDPKATPVLRQAEGGGALVDGGKNLGIPAFLLATRTLIDQAAGKGMGAIGIANVDHTGRLGAFARMGAKAGCLTIIFGGGSRKDWRQVAPHDGAKAILPTNPFAFALPASANGPVVVDFATSTAAGGKVYAAKLAGRALPLGLCIDAHGHPTTYPDDEFNGGALLPMGGPKGYGMALVAELLGEAILGKAMDGMNWIAIAVNLARFREPSAYQRAAESYLEELRNCPPAPGFDRVEIPGEREDAKRAACLRDGIPLPLTTIKALRALADRLHVSCVGLPV
jgi:LDH2 family malate/lactate/ureidoglycolate dehydrogenase